MAKLKFFLILLSIVSLNSSCMFIDTITSPEFNNKIHGSGVLITEERTLANFNSVEMTTSGKVFLTSDSNQQVSVTVDSNIIKYIYTTVSDGKLYIGVQRGVQLSNINLIVNIKMNNLEELRTISSGDIIGQNKFKADVVCLSTVSSGNIEMELETDKLCSSISSSGNIFLSGSTLEHEVNISSSGDLHSFNFVTETTKISISSSGNAEVYVSDFLDVILSSSGSLYYKGYPSITYSVLSSGKIYNANG